MGNFVFNNDGVNPPTVTPDVLTDVLTSDTNTRTVAADLTFGTQIPGIISDFPDAGFGNYGLTQDLSLFFLHGYSDGYLGFQLSNGDYGWIGIRNWWNDDIVITDYAFNETPGDSILAGDTGPAVPEPNSIMLMLSAAAAGLPLYRRFRKSAPVA